MTCWPIPVFLACLLGFTVLLKEHVSVCSCRHWCWCSHPCLLGFRAMKGLPFSSLRVCCDFAVCKWRFLLSYCSLNQCHSLKQQRSTAHLIGTLMTGLCVFVPVCMFLFMFVCYILKPDSGTFYFEDFLELPTQSSWIQFCCIAWHCFLCWFLQFCIFNLHKCWMHIYGHTIYFLQRAFYFLFRLCLFFKPYSKNDSLFIEVCLQSFSEAAHQSFGTVWKIYVMHKVARQF